MARFDQIGLNRLVVGQLSTPTNRVSPPQYVPVTSETGWRDYTGPGWYVVVGPPQGLGLVISETISDVDGFYQSTKIKLLPGTRVEVIDAGSKSGRAVISKFSINGQVQEIGPNRIGYIRRLNYEGNAGRQLLVREDRTNAVSGYRVGQLAPLSDVLGPPVLDDSRVPMRRRNARTVSQRFSGYIQPGWYRLSKPKKLRIHSRPQSVYGVQELFSIRVLPAGTMVELDQARNVLPATAYQSAIVQSTNSSTFVSKFISDGKIYKLEADTVAYFRSGGCGYEGVASATTFMPVPQFIPSAPLGEFTKSANRVAMPIAMSPLVPLSQARPGIAIPATPGRDIGDPVQPTLNVFSPIPQNGMPMTRLARFGQLPMARRFTALDAAYPPGPPTIPANRTYAPLQRDIGIPVSPVQRRVSVQAVSPVLRGPGVDFFPDWQAQASAAGLGYVGPGVYVITQAPNPWAGDAVVFDRNGMMIGRLAVGTVVQVEGEGFYSDEGAPGLSVRISSPINGNLSKVSTAFLRQVQGRPLTLVGLYRIIDPNGLRAAVRTGAGGSRPVANLPYGSIVRLVSNDVGGGWFQITEPFIGYVLAGDGTGLTPTQIQPGAFNPRRMYANRIIRPIGPYIRGIGQAVRFPTARTVLRTEQINPAQEFIATYNPASEARNYPRTRPQMDFAPPLTTPPFGYTGRGTYRITWGGGLNVRSRPGTWSSLLQVLPQGTVVNLEQFRLADPARGERFNPNDLWIKVTSPVDGWLQTPQGGPYIELAIPTRTGPQDAQVLERFNRYGQYNQQRISPNYVEFFRQVPGAPLGYAGPGMYAVIKGDGLDLYSSPSVPTAVTGHYPIRSIVEVVAVTTNGYVQISRPQPGYMCLNCAAFPGGPWLMRQS